MNASDQDQQATYSSLLGEYTSNILGSDWAVPNTVIAGTTNLSGENNPTYSFSNKLETDPIQGLEQSFVEDEEDIKGYNSKEHFKDMTLGLTDKWTQQIKVVVSDQLLNTTQETVREMRHLHLGSGNIVAPIPPKPFSGNLGKHFHKFIRKF